MQIWTRLPSVSFQKKRQSSFWKKTLGMSLPRLLFLSWHPFKTNFFVRTHRCVWCKEFGKCATTVRDTPNDARVFITNTQHQRLLARNWIRCFIDTHRESIRISLWDWNSTSFKNLHLMKSARGDRKFLEKPPKAFAQGQGFSWSGKKQARNSAGAAIPCYRNNRPSSFRTWPYYQFDLWVQLREHPLRSSYR